MTWILHRILCFFWHRGWFDLICPTCMKWWGYMSEQWPFVPNAGDYGISKHSVEDERDQAVAALKSADEYAKQQYKAYDETIVFWRTQCEALEKALSEIAQEKFLRRMVADDLAIETLAAHRKAVEAFGKETK